MDLQIERTTVVVMISAGHVKCCQGLILRTNFCTMDFGTSSTIMRILSIRSSTVPCTATVSIYQKQRQIFTHKLRQVSFIRVVEQHHEDGCRLQNL